MNSARTAETTLTTSTPSRSKVQLAVSIASRDGPVERQPCEACGGTTEEVHAFHRDFADPLDVRRLCLEHEVPLPKCMTEIHNDLAQRIATAARWLAEHLDTAPLPPTRLLSESFGLPFGPAVEAIAAARRIKLEASNG